jgi:hypothetical protein
MNMKLYDLKRGQKLRIVADSKTPPAHRELKSDEVLKFGHIDGMYSLCYDQSGQYVHPVAWSEVELVPDEPSGDTINFQNHEQSR